MEIMQSVALIVIIIELFYICIRLDEKEEKEVKETRRTVRGDFANPLADSYRKNSRGQLRPIMPGARMLDGDEEDEV